MSPPHRLRRAGGLVVLLAALFGGGLALAGSAQAHATVVSSDPADGARLRAVPAQVSVNFDEPVTLGSLGYLHVTDSRGARVDSGAAFYPGGDGTKIAVRLRPGLGDGTYVESFRVISADSHPVAGIVRFVVGTGALVVPSGSPAATTDAATGAVFDVARWVSYAGLALLAAVWLPLTVWPRGAGERRVRRTVWAGWGLAVGAAVAELWLQGPYAAGRGLGGLADADLLDGTLHTAYGQFHSARLVLLGVLAVLVGLVFAGRRGPWRHVAWPLLLGVAATFSVTGHADTTNPRWLSIALDMAHLSAMAVWVGGLVLVLWALLPRAEEADVLRVAPVFSRAALAAVVTLAATGTYAAWRGIGAWRAVLGTEYGLLVVTKVLLFVCLIALGALARHTLRNGKPAGPSGRERLRRGVVVELALAALVLAATSILVAQPRGREALAAQDRQPVRSSAPLGDGRVVTVTVEPGVHGPVTTQVELTGGPEPKTLSVTATQPARGIGPLPVPVEAEGGGLYGASAVNLPAAGSWVFEVVVTDSAFNATTVDVKITLH